MGSTIWHRLWRADETRRTRFHTSNDKLCLAPGDIIFALATTILRHGFGYLAPIPWITLPAIQLLRSISWVDRIGFEYSAGTSTLWYGRRCKKFYAVEHNPAWLNRMQRLCAGLDNVQLYHHTDQAEYITAIERCGEPSFDLISIDGLWRYECYRHALSFLKTGGVLVIDNTDADYMQAVVADQSHRFAPENIHVFPGYVSGIFHPNETTICIKS